MLQAGGALYGVRGTAGVAGSLTPDTTNGSTGYVALEFSHGTVTGFLWNAFDVRLHARHVSAGVVVAPARVAVGIASSALMLPDGGHDVVMEAYLRMRVSGWLMIQPDVQVHFVRGQPRFSAGLLRVVAEY